MPRIRVNEKLLADLQAWAVHRLTPEEYSAVEAVVLELRRLRKLISGNRSKSISSEPAATDDTAKPPLQCAFMRTLGGQQFRCTAPAKQDGFCGKHKPKKLKQLPKGCSATNRAGRTCKAIVLKNGLCPAHWRAKFGHSYTRDGQGFRCSLCGATFDYWTVEGRGAGRKGSIKSVAECPTKISALGV